MLPVDEFVNEMLREHDSVPARTQSLFLAESKVAGVVAGLNSARGISSSVKPRPGSTMWHVTMCRARTYWILTYWFGSSFPPCSIAFSSISRKAMATSFFSGSEKSAISLRN